jgi:hypothetical protein
MKVFNILGYAGNREIRSGTVDDTEHEFIFRSDYMLSLDLGWIQSYGPTADT